MKLLFMDTESSGMVDFKSYPDHPSQPKVLQIACLQTDEFGEEINSLSCLLQPDDIQIHPKALEVHKLSPELLYEKGLNRQLAIRLWHNMFSSSELIIGHNIDFDLMMFRISCLEIEAPFPLRSLYCTMKSSTDICKIPGRFPGSYKWPKLSEAHQFFFGEQLIGAHNALEDTRSVKRIYFALQQIEGMLSSRKLASSI